MRSVSSWTMAAVAAMVLAGASACGGGTTGSAGTSPTIDGGTGGTGGTGTPDAGPDGGTGTPDAGPDGGTGTPDAGPDGGAGTPDAGTPDAGTPDAGTPDAGTPDAGPGDAGIITFPNSDGWSFYGPQNGGPQDVLDVSMDEGGNVWVAGGTEGLFVLRAGSTSMQRFGIAEGLHPYGYLNGETAKYFGVPDGSPADKNPSLAATPVISVAGGPANTVYVGYQGKPGCEDAWKWSCDVRQCLQTDPVTHACTKYGQGCVQASPPSTWGDPAVYKSGDADKVSLSGTGISVVHYDIFSGPDVVGAEQGGREKICSVQRLVWDKAQDKIWFGGNHGFAQGKASYAGNPTCNGQYNGSQAHTDCSGVWEHSHPAFNACGIDNFDKTTGARTNCPSDKVVWLTDAYLGIGLEANGDVWFGGYNRSTVFHYGTYGGNTAAGAGLNAYYAAGSGDTEYPAQMPAGTCAKNNPNGVQYNGVPCGVDNRLDFWKDTTGECLASSAAGTCDAAYPQPGERKDDGVSGIAPIGGGKAWVSSGAWGLILADQYGNTLADPTARLMAKNISSIALDPTDKSVWAGMAYGLGISRYNPATQNVTNYSLSTFGDKLANAAIANIQTATVAGKRNMVVGFRKGGAAGAVGIYTGQ